MAELRFALKLLETALYSRFIHFRETVGVYITDGSEKHNIHLIAAECVFILNIAFEEKIAYKGGENFLKFLAETGLRSVFAQNAPDTVGDVRIE